MVRRLDHVDSTARPETKGYSPQHSSRLPPQRVEAPRRRRRSKLPYCCGFIAEAVGGQNEIRHLDGKCFDASIASELPPLARTLAALRESPTNYVLSDGDDKRIFRPPLEPAGPLGAQQFADIQWLIGAQTILVNSPKDEEPVGAIVDECTRTGSEIIFVLTPSLRAGFLKSTLPEVPVLIGAFDDLQFLTGRSPVSIGGAAMAAARLRVMAPNAEIHVTMGSLGVLSMAACSDEMTRVVLGAHAGAASEVRRIVKERPARLNGAGDAYAGGLLVRRAFGWSLLAGSGALLPHVRAALAGCASALRWIGVRSGLTTDAFVVRPLPVAAVA